MTLDISDPLGAIQCHKYTVLLTNFRIKIQSLKYPVKCAGFRCAVSAVAEFTG